MSNRLYVSLFKEGFSQNNIFVILVIFWDINKSIKQMSSAIYTVFISIAKNEITSRLPSPAADERNANQKLFVL